MSSFFVSSKGFRSSDALEEKPKPRVNLLEEAAIRMRLISIDPMMIAPVEGLDAESSFIYPEVPLKRVPVLRMFGITPSGQKACVHLHQLYPYIYVPYDGQLTTSDVQNFSYKLALSINHALAVSLNKSRDPHQSQYVMNVVLVKGIPFYGYTNELKYFVKIYLLDYNVSQRLSDLLLAGAVMGRVFQPFESHIPIGLQFMIDHNIYGMDYVDFKSVKYRGPCLARPRKPYTGDYPLITNDNLPKAFVWELQDGFLRQTSCELEMDSWPWFIENRLQVTERQSEPFHPVLERTKNLVKSLEELWEDERRRRAARNESTEVKNAKDTLERVPKEELFPYEKDVHEAIEKIIQQPGNDDKLRTQSQMNDQENVLTAFEAIGALYPNLDEPTSATTCRQGSISLSQISSPFKVSGQVDFEVELSGLVDEEIILSQVRDAFQQPEEERHDSDMDESDYWQDKDQQPRQETVEGSDGDLDLLLGEFSQRIPQVDGGNDDDDNDNERTFITKLDQMWSPDLKPEINITRPSFFFSPPKPFSPDTKKRKLSEKRRSGLKRVASFFMNIDESSAEDDVQIVEPLHVHEEEEPDFDPVPWKFSALDPPSKNQVKKDMIEKREPPVTFVKPFYSNSKDIPPKKLHVGRATIHPGNNLEFAPKFRPLDFTRGTSIPQSQVSGIEIEPPASQKLSLVFRLNLAPPRRSEVTKWANSLQPHQVTYVSQSQIQGPTREGFAFPQNSVTSNGNRQFLTLCSLEVHVNTRADLMPDPAKDDISFAVLCVQEESEGAVETFIFAVDDGLFRPKKNLMLVRDEEELVDQVVKFVTIYDPDLLIGYEIHNSSWGFLVERAALRFNVDLCALLSRVEFNRTSHFGKDNDAWGYKKTSSLFITGRIVLNVWRLMKSELSLTCYTYQAIAYHVLHIRVPKFSYATLTKWYITKHQGWNERWRTVKFLINKARNTLAILEESNLICQTSEFARVYGVEFYSVLSRGSQFKVESVMLRITRPENFLAISPNRRQVASMRAAEGFPLVMEPQSNFYTSPVIVLDFQSLYPSIMIAYNYCFSTCLGKVHPKRLETLGFMENFYVDPGMFHQVRDDVNISPGGTVFVKEQKREGILRKMLIELLDTRVMVKTAMKKYKQNKSLYRALDARQLGLKLLANVIYGYTSASFSGRMPCVEVADSIVQMGRYTLERSIKFINEHPDWKAKVVYADTDSLFINCEGASRERAHKLAMEMADTISAMNPKPMKLKFEKVYHPCVLLSKKRYVGFKYETVDQLEPEFDAKGIETVRRDGCPVVAKMLETSLKILFRTKDLSLLKSYMTEQWKKIVSGRISMQDFIIAKAVKLGTYSENGVPPPGVALSLRHMRKDHRAEPQYGERVPFIIAYDGVNPRLVDAARSPEEFVLDQSSRLHSNYYITRQIIPVLARIFDLIGVDVKSWFLDMPKVDRMIKYDNEGSWATENAQDQLNQTTLERFYKARHCLICHQTTAKDVCQNCLSHPAEALLRYGFNKHQAELKYINALETCRNCLGSHYNPNVAELCVSYECPNWYERVKTGRNFRWLEKQDQKVQALFPE